MADDQPEPDPERVQRRAAQRQHDLAESTESILDQVDALLREQDYPVSSEELAMEYGDETMDLPNETESLGSVFDRMVDEEFESVAEAREAIFNELTGEAGGPSEYNDERALSDFEGSEERLG